MSSGVRTTGANRRRLRPARGAGLDDGRQAVHGLRRGGIDSGTDPQIADGFLQRLDFACQRAGRGAEVAVFQFQLVVRGAKRRDLGACAESQAETDEHGQDEQRTEPRKHRTEIERHPAIHTGAPIGDNDRIPAVTLHRKKMCVSGTRGSPDTEFGLYHTECLLRRRNLSRRKFSENNASLERQVGSSPRNCSASATCAGVTTVSQARSAIVRATRSRPVEATRRQRGDDRPPVPRTPWPCPRPALPI